MRNLTQTVKDFADAWGHEALNALKMGVLGARIGGLQGAAIGAAAGFVGLTTSLKELGSALENPLVLAAFGGRGRFPPGHDRGRSRGSGGSGYRDNPGD